MTAGQKYDYAFDANGDAWAAQILRELPSTGAVLELGPGPGAMTRVLVDRGYDVTAVEQDSRSIEQLKPLQVRIVAADLEQFDWMEAVATRKYDAILACDVLEHLRDPEAVLSRLAGLLNPLGRLIISVPNVAYSGIVAGLLREDFEYAETGQLDKTHLRFFTRRSLEKMLLKLDWTPIKWRAHQVAVEDSEFRKVWNALPASQRSAIAAGPNFDVYQWMVVAGRSSDAQGLEVLRLTAEYGQLSAAHEELLKNHRAEHASLLEHQKAFSQAKELIASLQAQVNELRVNSRMVGKAGSSTWLRRVSALVIGIGRRIGR